ncbi:MAG: 4-hydroxy-tetrahydrodipicolinate reductase [Candidatus Cloacimonetes bacterium]|nr:4-hydroxy-tetrahydrodipicolinate reductase [Candidatus Cloacimonadota bacterium]
MSTRIALIGYGKMGKMIAGLAAEKGCEIVSCIDPNLPDCFSEINAQNLAEADVCIDFSHPSIVTDNIRKVLALKKPLVVGTTGWNGAYEEIHALVLKSGIGFIHGANFSIGMNLFSRIVTDAVKYIDRFDLYDVYGMELHHNQKADSPSGTAIELAKIIIANSSKKTDTLFDTCKRRIEPHELHFASVRSGNIPGTHTVGFDCEADTIELTHRVRSRSGFAYGALQAALWVKDNPGFYSFSEMISSIL